MIRATTVPSFGPEKLELLLTVVMRNPGLYEAARELIDAACFRDGEQPYMFAWQAYVQAATKAGSVLSVMAPAIVELQDAARAAPDMYLQVLVAPALAFFARVDATPAEATVLPDIERVVRQELRRFISERKAIDPLRRALSDARGFMLDDPRGVIEQVNSQLIRADALMAQSAHGVIPRTPFRQLEQISTGVEPIDRATGGGVSPRKLYGIFGPSGAFKTGLAVQLAVAAAQSEAARARQVPGYRAKLIIYAVYEGGREEIQLRAMSCGAEILKTRVKAYFSNMAPLTHTPYAHTYEREHQLELPETERFARAEEALESFRILDMSSSSESPNIGSGYIPELSASIDRTVREEGREVGAVFIDYAKLVARRHAMATGKLDDLTHLLGSMPDQLRISVAERHNTVLWILQQLDASANQKRAGAVLDHSQSSWAKDFGENLWYAFCLSKIDKANGHTTTMAASKTRDTEGLTRPYVLQLNGVKQKLMSTDEYTYDQQQGRIVASTAHDAFQNFEANDDEEVVHQDD